MFFNKFKRRSDIIKKEYATQVQEYLRINSFAIVQKIQNGILDGFTTNPEKVNILLGQNYPKAPWVNKKDNIGQFICLFEQTGYEFLGDTNGNVTFDANGLNRSIIQNYLRVNGKEMMERLSVSCQKTHGRISYRHMLKILGFEDYQVECANDESIRYCILLFMEETKLPFKHNDTHIYLP